MVSFTTLALMATTAMAGPLALRQIAIPEGWNWQVEGWTAGCGRAGCYYSFNVTVPSVPEGPAGVKAYCMGYEQGYDQSFMIPSAYTDCEILEGVNNGVAARFSEREHDGNGFGPKEIEVSFEYAGYGDRPAYNFSGTHETRYNQFSAPPLNFTITPTKVFGIA